jgi:membrane protease YdiL (CAAX protease family)
MLNWNRSPNLDESTAGPIPHGYWYESRRPLTSLVFVLPLLAVYEIGVIFLGTDAIRNGVDIWLRDFFTLIGLGHYFMLPVLTVGILLAWHYISREPWKIELKTLLGMVLECLVLAFLLRVLLSLQSHLLPALPEPGEEVVAITVAISQACRELVLFVGAGIYEELFFRLILLTGVIWLLRQSKMNPRTAIVLGIVFTSLLFSMAHYLGGQSEQFLLFGFIFRFIAGVFFSVLFVFRGFGIAAGTHAAYDILITF